MTVQACTVISVIFHLAHDAHCLHECTASGGLQAHVNGHAWCVGTHVVIHAYLQGWTPLHYAAHKRSNEMAGVLIDAGANVSAQNEKVCAIALGWYMGACQRELHSKHSMRIGPALHTC